MEDTKAEAISVPAKDLVIPPTNTPAMDLMNARDKVAAVNGRVKMPVKEKASAEFR